MGGERGAPASDHFSGVAAAYAEFRPRYPDALFSFLAALAPGRDLAWDCATGSGQAAVGLAAHFVRVVATDLSVEQVAHAEGHPRVAYAVAPAERSGLGAGSADLVTVAQALHWLVRPAFFAEADRVLRPGGVLAVWSYGPLRLAEPAARKVFDRFYSDVVGPYWPPERQLVDDGYRQITLPFEEVTAPAFAMETALTLAELAGYVGTWSATQSFVRARGSDPVPELVRELDAVWGEPDRPRPAAWPLALRIGRKAA